MDPAPKRARLATGTGVGGAAAGPRVRVVFINRTTGPLHLGPRDAGGAVRVAVNEEARAAARHEPACGPAARERESGTHKEEENKEDEQALTDSTLPH